MRGEQLVVVAPDDVLKVVTVVDEVRPVSDVPTSVTAKTAYCKFIPHVSPPLRAMQKGYEKIFGGNACMTADFGIHHVFDDKTLQTVQKTHALFSSTFSTRIGAAVLGSGAGKTNLNNKKDKPMSLKIETITFINGTAVKHLTEDQIFRAIAEAEAEIERLRSLKHMPLRLSNRAAELETQLKKFIALLNESPEAEAEAAE